jgi:hypothetical protein
MERRLGIMQSVEPVLENAIKTLQKVVDVRGMGKKSLVYLGDDVPDAAKAAEDKKAAEAIKAEIAASAEKKERPEPLSADEDLEEDKRLDHFGLKTKYWNIGKKIIKEN